MNYLDAWSELEGAPQEGRGAMALLLTLLDTAPVGLAFFDRSLRLLRVNQTLARTNVLPVEDHIGKTIRELLPSLADQIEPLLRRVLETGKEVQDALIRGPNPQKGGAEGAWVNNYYPVKDASGRVAIISVVVFEVTERLQAEEALRRAAEFRERFLGIVAHDLRSPLTSISTGASMLLRMEGLPPSAYTVARAMRGSAQRMQRMIGLLRDFTHARLGVGLPIAPRFSDLSEALGAIVLEARLAHPNRRLQARYPTHLIGFWDPDRVMQAVENLLRNAFDHGAEGTPVRLVAGKRDGWLRVAVCNRNKGGPIPPEIQPTLFDPFRPHGEQSGAGGKGLGLGLYIAREIARAHGGNIEVRSLERGTRFTLCLPLNDEVTGSSLLH